jgi:ABC-type nitrate/sulfonate/bicarbonate transport system substrate-binding protein
MTHKIRCWFLFPCSVMLASVVSLLAALSLSSCTKPSAPEKAEKVRIAIYPDTVSALIYIARDQGFFKRHGLDVSFEDYQTGVFAVNGLIAGKADAATATEFVLAIQGFQRQDLRGIAAVSFSDSMEVIARRDREIKNPEDLRGKIVGAPKNTIAEFFLNAFLSLKGVLPGEVRMVDLKPTDLVPALSEGKIDAASCFPPFSDTMKKNLARNAVSWPIQGGQDYHLVLIIRDELIKTRPLVVTSLLKGALDAGDFLGKNEGEAQSIVERALGLDHESVVKTWAKTRFRVRLDQALLTLIEDEGRWAIRNKMVAGPKVPNYLNFLYLDGLEKINPDLVTVIR